MLTETQNYIQKKFQFHYFSYHYCNFEGEFWKLTMFNLIYEEQVFVIMVL